MTFIDLIDPSQLSDFFIFVEFGIIFGMGFAGTCYILAKLMRFFFHWFE